MLLLSLFVQLFLLLLFLLLSLMFLAMLFLPLLRLFTWVLKLVSCNTFIHVKIALCLQSNFLMPFVLSKRTTSFSN